MFVILGYLPMSPTELHPERIFCVSYWVRFAHQKQTYSFVNLFFGIFPL